MTSLRNGQKGEVNTKVLCDLIRQCQEQRDANSITPTVFKDTLEDEILRSVDFVEKLQLEIVSYAKSLLRKIDCPKVTFRTDTAESFLRSADSIVDAVVRMKQLEDKNQTALVQIADLADSALSDDGSEGNVSYRSLCEHHLSNDSRNEGVFSDLVILISDIYAAIKDFQSRSETKKTWTAPASFERSTNKYWVHDDRLVELLVRCAKEAPLLVYGQSGRLSSHVDMEESSSPFVAKDNLWTEVASHITSVYFDSPRMEMYKERIARHEGAQLFRVRWYGTKRPTEDEPVFLELKTHHEKWVNVKSVKERVTIKERDMMTFLSPVGWTEQEAKRLVLAGSPKLKGEAREKAVKLLETMHQLVVTKDLRPCVRSTYYRLAFQSPESNSLRLTLDRNVTLIDERSAFPHSWCLSDEAVIKTNMVVRVPFSVFEVKLAGSDSPELIENMKETQVILDAAKFSKFLTGAAAFNSHVIQTLPYWAEEPSFAPLFGTTICAEKETAPLLKSSKAAKNLFSQPKGPSSSGPSKSIAPKRPARVEPKSYFANERTFIQWISASLLLVTIAVILLEFQSTRMDSLNTGLALLGIAACVVIYAIFVYFRRLQLLASGSSYGYVDRLGPILLGVAVLAGLIILLSYFMDHHEVLRGSETLVSNDDECYQHSLQNISRLEYQPSDIIYDQDRSMFLVPSLAQITGVPADGGDTVELIKIDGMDFEAITFAGSRIFAISEDKDFSLLVELKWDNLRDNKLVELQRWEIPSENAEGIAFVPSLNGPNHLYVSGDNRSTNPMDRGTLSFYEIPEESASLNSRILTPAGRLNENLLNDGLTDSRAGAITFFEGVLYLLHDNAQLVRAWDIASGNLLAEWPLPRVGRGFDNQWEGMAIERRPTSEGKRTGLRSKDKDGELVLHLALDTPPQVWSIRVQEGIKRGEIVFPSCAGL